jgi:hypothetical protein
MLRPREGIPARLAGPAAVRRSGGSECWEKKKGAIREREQPAARKAYDEARAAYRKIQEECAAE